MDQPAVEVEGLSKRFGSVVALDGIDLEVPPGIVFALLGPNGAGKTTMVRILTTLVVPDVGRAQVAGFDVVRDRARVRSVIGLAGQYAALDEDLTGRENLELINRLHHTRMAAARDRASGLLEHFGLVGAGDRPVRTHSGGMRRRLDLAASLVPRPSVLFLDEPTTGLDPRTRAELWDEIGLLVHEGTALVLTTQYLEEADRLANRIAMISAADRHSRHRRGAQGRSRRRPARIDGGRPDPSRGRRQPKKKRAGTKAVRTIRTRLNGLGMTGRHCDGPWPTRSRSRAATSGDICAPRTASWRRHCDPSCSFSKSSRSVIGQPYRHARFVRVRDGSLCSPPGPAGCVN
jgi:ABC-type Na+ transport system ATPase subunit NatA